MKVKPKIKVCGITRKADAETALDLGADFLGINLFDRSPRFVEWDRVADLLSVIPAGKRVCVDVNPGTDRLDSCRGLGFDFYQIHCIYTTGMDTLAGWSGLTGRENLWLAPKVPPEEPFPQVALEFADSILYDSYAHDPLVFGGTGRVSDWIRFEEWRTLYSHKTWILAGGLSPDNIREALRQTTPDIVDVNSGVESEPGIKDPKKLRNFFQELE